MADEEQTQKAAEKPDVEAQLDALLGRIEEEQTGENDADTATAVSSSPKEAPAGTDDPEPAVEAVEAEDSLADQVQELLDQDRAAEDSAAEELVPPSQAHDQKTGAEADSDTDPLGVQIDQLLDMAREQEGDQSADLPATAPEAVEAETAGQPSPAEARPSEGKTDSETVKDLDRILADSADDAVAGDYDTIEQVLAEEQTATSAPAAQTDTTTAEAPFAGESDDENLPEGMFETPEQIQAGADSKPAKAAEPIAAPVGGGDFTAGAEDVARELAEQPESMPQEAEPEPVAASAKASPSPATGDGSRGRSIAAALGSRVVGVAGRTPDLALRVCTTINKPVRRLPAEWQNTVGYIGLLTFFNATVIMVYKLLSTAFAG